MLDWMDVSSLPFNTVLLFERVQIGWMPSWTTLSVRDLAVALRGNPTVEWYLRHKCPEIGPWLDRVMGEAGGRSTPAQVRAAEVAVMRALMDPVVYVHDPAIYDAQPFLGWDSRELTDVADYSGATVIDVGAGTGRLALTVAPMARTVYAVEPVANLRDYLRQKARRQGLHNVYVVDGMLHDLPFPAGFADVTLCGHAFGHDPAQEYREMARVTRAGGMVVLCPGTTAENQPVHDYLVALGFAWSQFEEPVDGTFHKYWKREARPAALRA